MKFLKKAGALALAVIMAAGMLTAGAAYEDLTDKDDIVNKESVQALVELGVLGGRDDGSFDPAAYMTRQEAAKVMAVMLCGGDFNAVPTDKVYFTDTADAWGLAYINYVAEKSIMGGHGDGIFAPDEAITAEQLAKMLLVALGEDSTLFVGDVFKSNVEIFSARRGITAGLENITMDAPITRDDMALMVCNALAATTSEGITLREACFGNPVADEPAEEDISAGNGYVLIDPEKTAIRYDETQASYVYSYNVYYADGSAAAISTTADIQTYKVYLLKDGYMSDRTNSAKVIGVYGNTLSLDTDATPGADTYLSLAEGCVPVIFAKDGAMEAGAGVVYALDDFGAIVGIWVVD